jgi:prolyl-tRNA synthetase
LQSRYQDEVVLDDRDERPGFKFKDADLIGYPYQIVVSDKTLEQGEDIVELTERMTGQKRFVSYKSL